jgi:hypothetical protein
MKQIPEVGDVITLKAFAFSGKEGGTGLSNWDHDEQFIKPAKVLVTKEWQDEECGQRGWATPLESENDLIEYLDRNANKRIVYWSEFDILNNTPLL